VNFKAFSKEKKDADGNMTSLKTRGVGRGDQQKLTIYEKKSSPTASTQSLFTVATVGANEGKLVCTYDFPGAYLNARREGRAPKVYVRFNKFQTQVMCKIDPEWHKCVRPDGTSIGEATGALYGLLESGGLWNEDVVILFKSLNYSQSMYDPCVFYKKGVRIVLYVDDLYITYDNEGAIKDLQSTLLDKFGGEFKYPIDDTVEFLGMKIKQVDRGIFVTMPDKLQDVTAGIQESASTPAGNNLFTIDENAKELEQKQKEKFHTLVAKLLYISKRVRPDILLAVTFLTTRVQNPRQDDWTKLIRVLRYLRKTKHKGLTLRIGESVFVQSYIDASYGPHADGKSHTGAIIGIGDALAILAKSSKQKVVTKSSTEAELIAVTDVVSDVLDLKGFVEELGYSMSGTEKPAIVYQDNQSTIKLMENGPPSNSKSKHVRIRTFWLRERIEEGQLKVTFCPTDKMIADGLTKPLQGAQFESFADQILGKQ
jgi:hypothetical protein